MFERVILNPHLYSNLTPAPPLPLSLSFESTYSSDGSRLNSYAQSHERKRSKYFNVVLTYQLFSLSIESPVK